MEIKRETKEWVDFKDFKEFIKEPFEEGWLTIYKSLSNKNKKQISSVIFSTFIKKEFKEKSLEKIEWDFLMLYLNYDSEEIEPLIFYRNFHGIKETFFEISEKFRHYFNLYSKEDKNYYFLDESGDDIQVIDFKKDEIKINVKFLFEYLREKSLILSLGFDLMRWHDKEIKEYGLEKESEKIKNAELNYSFYSRNENFGSDNAKSFSSICGKRHIEVPKDFEESVLNPERKYEEFIVDIDKLGNNLNFTCEEKKLGNYFGKNPNSPQFTKSIFFKKEVLDKYYGEPSKYSVEDGYLSCKGLWGIRIDNNLKMNVAVLLGDLGRLPHKEQKHWKLYNIQKGKISEPFFKRNFEAEFCSPSCPVEYFKERIKEFNKNWKDKFGWELFKPLNKEDEHHLKTLRIPKNQKEFDENILSLIKIIIDSLNNKSMNQEVGTKEKEQSISLLRRYLNEKHQINSTPMISFLKDIQNLRSKGAVHRKGSDFSEFYKKYDKGNFSKTFEYIVIGTIKTLNTIEKKVFWEQSEKI